MEKTPKPLEGWRNNIAASLKKLDNSMKQTSWENDIASLESGSSLLKVIETKENRAKIILRMKNIRDKYPSLKTYEIPDV